MRRRQSANDTSNGIFILASPELSSGKNKSYVRPQRNSRSSFIILFGLLAIIISVTLVLRKKPSSPFTPLNPIAEHSGNDITTASHEQLASNIPDIVDGDEQLPTSLTALNIPDTVDGDEPLPTALAALNVGDHSDSDISASHEQSASSSDVTDSAAGDNNFIATPQMGTSEPPRIPRRLIFTYKYNLLDPAVGDPPFDPDDPLTLNVLKTIETYRNYWDAKDAKAPKEQPKEEVVVSFLSDADCLEAIAKVEPLLVKRFYTERKGTFKADICRAAELYLHGGYYFDIDIGVIEPLNFDALDIPSATPDVLAQLRTMNRKNLRTTPGPDDVVTLSTVYSRHQGGFFQGFTAATPRHPVLKKSLGYMDAYYEGTLGQTLPQHIIEKSHNAVVPSRTKPQGMGVGPYTLSVAYRSTTHEEWEEYVRDMMKDHGYSSGNEGERPYGEIPAKRRYARFLYEISLEDKEVKRLGLWADVPLQDAEYQRKVKWCNYVCFGGQKVYFYSRVPGTKVCPLEKKFV